MKPLTMECERCGQEHTVQRAGRFSDDDYLELHHEYMALERQYRADLALLQMKLAAARERVDQLRELVNTLALPPVPERVSRWETETA